jgi:hypothetical protein
MFNPLKRMAERSRTEPLFFGYLLERYARSESLDDAALAARLGIALEKLTLLRLAGRPAEDPGRRREDIRILAEAYGIEYGVLMDVVKHALALTHLQAATQTDDSPDAVRLLMAARDAEGPAGEDEKP